MKYAITGHTSGIGKAFFNRMSPDVLGFSRRVGYNIRDNFDRALMLEEAEDVDVFINNAYAGWGQCELLHDLYCMWRGRDKLVINIGSVISEPPHQVTDNRIELLEYWMHKCALRDLSNNLAAVNNGMRSVYIPFGYVGTERILEKYPDLTDYITPDEAVDRILRAV